MHPLVSLLERWKESPYDGQSTRDLSVRFVRELSKPFHGIDPALHQEFVDRAASIHGQDLEVVLCLAGLCLTSGEIERAGQLLDRLSPGQKTDPRVAKLNGKVRLHLDVQSTRFPQLSSSPPPSQTGTRQVNAADLLTRLNRRLGDRASGVPLPPSSRPGPASVRSPAVAASASPPASSPGVAGPPGGWPPRGTR